MTNRVAEFCRRHDMLPRGGKVLCAVSGGADSMAMLFMLLELSGSFGVEIECAHFNHMIRGDEAARDEDFVRSECERLGVVFTAGRGDVPAYARAHGLGTEEAARELRYEFLEKTASERGCAKIATAHNAADNAETMLMNLARGAGLRGASGIPPVRGRLIRPLLCLDRPEIEAYLAGRGVSFVTDSTNLSTDYARNRMRQRVIAPLREAAPDFGAKFLAACESMREDEELISSLVPPCPNGEIAASELAALPRPVASRLIMRLAPGAQRTHVEAVLALAGSGKQHGRLSLPGCEVLMQFGKLRFGAEIPPEPPETELPPGAEILWGGYAVSRYEGEARAGRDFLCFKSSAICGNITLGPRREGDRLKIAGRGVTKTLKKLFSEARIPPSERGGVPVLRDGLGVLGAYGFGADERAAARRGERCTIVEFKKIGG